MLTAVHTLIYADDPTVARAFFRDVLGYPVADDGDGWLIFKLPPAELGVHPTEGGTVPTGTMKLSLMCDDIATTVAELEAKGVEILGAPVDRGYGLVTSIRVPGGVELEVYEPHHATAHDLPG
jgi:predicted enzyme related to lactoylglutathione lyase